MGSAYAWPRRQKAFGAVIAALIALFVTTTGCSAREVEETMEPIAGPAMLDGRQIGCDLSFAIAHGPSRGNWTRGLVGYVGEYRLDKDHGTMVLKIGLQLGSYPAPVKPPASAVFVDGDTTNAGEIFSQSPPDPYGYITVTFVTTGHTEAILQSFLNTGVMHIRFRMPDSEEQTWALDVSQRTGVRQAWAKCPPAIVLDPPPRARQ